MCRFSLEDNTKCEIDYLIDNIRLKLCRPSVTFLKKSDRNPDVVRDSIKKVTTLLLCQAEDVYYQHDEQKLVWLR